MTSRQLELITEIIKETIQEKVNGKIDKINIKFDNYIREDNEWKESVTPSIEIMKKIQGTSTVLNWVFKTIILLGSVGTVLYCFYKFLIKDL